MPPRPWWAWRRCPPWRHFLPRIRHRCPAEHPGQTLAAPRKKSAEPPPKRKSISLALRHSGPRASRIPRALRGHSRVRQLFYGRVGFRANQQYEIGDIYPKHENNEAGQGTVNFGDIRGMLNIEVESESGQKKRQRNERGAGGDPVPSLLYVGQEIIDQVDGDQNQQEIGNPARDIPRQFGGVEL